ncbi:hypothetical protein P280DRAFT_198913 [Massarina eburnea CBS 473.64]|uniref:Cwf18 pre-mRNA splicing factor n=1 Tax=Massarina eburnea CBS 473.64 TaxID=1395130 RepID=A0A6A6RJ64_9PLEO|nr:hypothetical protein P280DRAFT_198913 [Massarina eburnea CBS 473.64]
MSSHEKLSAAANDRKARLAQLKSLKRKQAPDSDSGDTEAPVATTTSTALTTAEPSITTTYLSGRNFDPETRNVKLGFDNTPVADPTKTLEYQAEQLAIASKEAQEAEKKDDKGLDLFKLQPKRPNWDLKRDLEEKCKGLEVQTENAIARLVRERVEGMKREKMKVEGRNGGGGASGEGETVGMEGSELVEAMHLKEREEEEDRRRDTEDADVS